MGNKKQDVEFKDAEGLPGNAHAKKLAKDKAEAEKKSKENKAKYEQVVYTQVPNTKKVVQVTVFPRGAKSVYMGNLVKHKKHFLGDNGKGDSDGQIHIWRKQGLWIGPDSFEEKCEEIRNELYEKSLKAG